MTALLVTLSTLLSDLVSCYLQGEAVDLKPFDAQLMLPVDKTPVSLLLDGTHVGRGSEWSAILSYYETIMKTRD